MRKTLVTLSLCGLAIANSGCSTWKKPSPQKSSKEPWSITKLWKKEYQRPQSMAVIWAPDVLAMPGSPPTRGFGGRVYFYNERTQAVPVDGDLIVHGYLKHDRRSGVSEHISADKTFAFTAEQLTKHFSPSEIGASYSIWIPWDEADGMRTEVTLIPTFKGKDGSIVQGTPSKVNLPGKAPAGVEERQHNPMQTVSYTRTNIPTNPGTSHAGDAPTMRTTTIAIPPTSSIGKNNRQPTFTLEPQTGTNNSNLDLYSVPYGQPLSGSGVTVGGGVTGHLAPSGAMSLPSNPSHVGPQSNGQYPAQPTQSLRPGEMAPPFQQMPSLPVFDPRSLPALPSPVTSPLPSTAAAIPAAETNALAAR
jgi:hypothetical protein